MRRGEEGDWGGEGRGGEDIADKPMQLNTYHLNSHKTPVSWRCYFSMSWGELE